VEDREDPRRNLGRRGEAAAARHLQKHGYRILGRGVRLLRGEIDIIARGRDGTLVFVEVKTRAGPECGPPEEAVTFAKRDQLRRIAQAYLSRHRLEDAPCRFDVIAVSIPDDGHTALTHFEDAF
jgi:putative endonuclease